MSHTTALTDLGRAVSAELVRTRRTTSARLALAGLAISALQGLGWAFLSTRDLTSWRQLTSWQSVYATALAVPMAALLGGITVQREHRAREAGTSWRPTRPATVRAARTGVAALQLLLFILAITLPTLLWGTVAQLPDPPLAQILTLVSLQWALSLAPLTLGLVGTRRLGLLTTLLAAIGWQIAGTLNAESATWWAQPWTWHLRPLLPLLGVHANGVPLEPGSPVWTFPWTPSLAGSLALTALLLVTDEIHLTRRRRGPGRTNARASQPRPTVLPFVRTAPRPTLAVAATLRRTAIPWLVGITLLALPAIAVLWRAAGVRDTVGYLILPLGSCLLATLAWQAQHHAWTILATRRSITDLGLRLLGVCAATVTALACAAGAVIAAAGGSQIAEFIAVTALSGTAGTACCLYLTTRHGTGTAIGATLITITLSLVLGGYFTNTPLWIAGPAAWAATAADTPRALIACTLSALACAVATTLWLRAIRRSITYHAVHLTTPIRGARPPVRTESGPAP